MYNVLEEKKKEYDLLMSLFLKKNDSKHSYSMSSILNCLQRELKRGLVTDVIEYLVESDNGLVKLKVNPSNIDYPISITTFYGTYSNQLFFDINLNVKNIKESHMIYYNWIKYALPHLYLPGSNIPRWMAKSIRIEGDRKNTSFPSLGVVCMQFRDLDYLKKLRIYIDMINSGYVPKTNEMNVSFNGTDVLIKQFWRENYLRIRDILNSDELYEDGYERAKYVVNILCSNITLKMHSYIELLNSGSYIPRNMDNDTFFPGMNEKIGTYWHDHRKQIKEILETRDEYKIGYEVAYNLIKKSFLSDEEKIDSFINLLNTGTYIPRLDDKHNSFTEYDKVIRVFYSENSNEIYNELFNNPKYKEGYEVAKYVLNLYNSLVKTGLYGTQLFSKFKSSIIVLSSRDDIAKKIAIDNGWIEFDNDNVRKKR